MKVCGMTPKEIETAKRGPYMLVAMDEGTAERKLAKALFAGRDSEVAVAALRQQLADWGVTAVQALDFFLFGDPSGAGEAGPEGTTVSLGLQEWIGTGVRVLDEPFFGDPMGTTDFESWRPDGATGSIKLSKP